MYVKREDYTELALGGNKVRQLEFYMGEARARSADTVLITGAVQSNYVRAAAAASRRLRMDIHIQLEDRVPNQDRAYRESGNFLIDRMLGATMHSYASGEDEAGADRRLEELAAGLLAQGRNPFVIHLGPGHPPLGALGYLAAARELLAQGAAMGVAFDEVVVASGSGQTHSGLLFGLRALGCGTRVTGVCVRRSSELQRPRIAGHCFRIAELLDIPSPVGPSDIHLMDDFLPPGYGLLNPPTVAAIRAAAREEALLLDPVYTGKAMAGMMLRTRAMRPDDSILFVHTGGCPGIFGYEPALTAAL